MSLIFTPSATVTVEPLNASPLKKIVMVSPIPALMPENVKAPVPESVVAWVMYTSFTAMPI